MAIFLSGYLNLFDDDTDLDFEPPGRDVVSEKDGVDLLFIRLDPNYGRPFTRIPPMDLSNNGSLTSQMILPSGEVFHWHSMNGLSASPTWEEARGCPWNPSACSDSEFFNYIHFDERKILFCKLNLSKLCFTRNVSRSMV